MDPRMAQMEQLFQMLAGSLNPSAPWQNALDSSQSGPFGGTIWDVHRMDSIYPERSVFISPMIDKAMQMMFPSMVAPGLDGNPTFMLNTNFTRTRAPGSSASRAVAQKNMQASQFSGLMYNRAQQNTWNTWWGDNGGVMKLFDAAGVDDNSFAKMLANYAHTDVGGKWADAARGMVQPMISQLLGYDRGTEMTVAQQRSMGIASAWNAGLGNGRSYDPYSDEFQSLRGAADMLVGRVTDKSLYTGNVKNAEYYGMSSQLLSNIVADALGNGEADKALHNVDLGSDVTDLIEAAGLGDRIDTSDWGAGDTESGKWNLQRVQQIAQETAKQVAELSKKNNELDFDINQEKKKSEGEQDQVKIQEWEAELKSNTEKLNNTLKLAEKSTDALSDGMKPLATSIAETMDSLKDLYESEDDAAKALNQLTGGQGFHFKEAADAARKQVDELAVISGMAGLDPSIAGGYLTKMSAGLGVSGSDLARGSAYQGQMGMAFTKDMLVRLNDPGMKGVAPEEKQKMMEAYTKAAADYDNSPHKKLAIMAMMQKDELGKKNYEQIVNLMNSGNQGDFQKAKKLMATFMGGQGVFDRVFNDQAFLAHQASKFSIKDSEELGNMAVGARNNEIRINKDKAQDKAVSTVTASRLSAAGFRKSEIADISRTGEAKGLEDFLNAKDENGEFINTGDGADEARALLGSYKDSIKSAHPDWDDNRVTQEAWRQFQRNKGMDLLSPEMREKVQTAVREGGKTNLVNATHFNGDNTLTMGVDNNSFLAQVGVADENNNVTRVAVGEANENLFKILKNHGSGLRTSDGNKIDMDTVRKNYDRWNEAFKSGDIDTIQEASNAMTSFFGSLDKNSQNIVSRFMGNSHYTTQADLERTENQNTIVQKALENEYFGDSMKNLDRDTQIKYAEYLDKTHEGDFDEEKYNAAVAARDAYRKHGGLDAQFSDLERIFQAIDSGKVTSQEAMDALRPQNMSKEQWAVAQEQFVHWLGGSIGKEQEQGPVGKEALTSTSTYTLLGNKEKLLDFQLGGILTTGTLAGMSDDEVLNYAKLIHGDAELSMDSGKVKALLHARDKVASGDGAKIKKGMEDLNAINMAALTATEDKFTKEFNETWTDDKQAEDPEGYKKVKAEYEQRSEKIGKRREKLKADADAISKFTKEGALSRQKELIERAEGRGGGAEASTGAPSAVSINGPVSVVDFPALLAVLGKIDTNTAGMAVNTAKIAQGSGEDKTAAA